VAPVSSGNDVRSNAEERLQIPAGQQALVAVPSVGSTLSHLPTSATENLLLVSSDSPEDVAESLTGMGVDLANVGLIPVSGSPVAYDGPMHVSQRIVPDDLTGLSMRISEALDVLERDRGWIVFDRLNVFLLYADEERVLRFLDHVGATTRDAGLRCLFCVVRDAVDTQTYAKLKRRVDREIDVK
jgi:hypothetical protein